MGDSHGFWAGRIRSSVQRIGLCCFNYLFVPSSCSSDLPRDSDSFQTVINVGGEIPLITSSPQRKRMEPCRARLNSRPFTRNCISY